MKTGLIYIIKNDINDKVYIGQTTLSLLDRWKAHIKPSTAKLKGNYKLYNAINKYGVSHFSIHLLEDNIPVEELNKKEIKYIEEYNSYYEGYNSTKGGDGRIINNQYDEKTIIQMYQQGMSSIKIAKKYNVSSNTICRILHKNKIPIRQNGQKLSNDIIDEVVYYASNHTYEQTAQYFQVNEKTIRRFLKKNGFHKRSNK